MRIVKQQFLRRGYQVVMRRIRLKLYRSSVQGNYHMTTLMRSTSVWAEVGVVWLGDIEGHVDARIKDYTALSEHGEVI
jgi:hypothetical protein